MADKTEMAENRTDWAEDRTVLANERTFAGWMRTGMAAVAIAIGLKAVFGAFEPTWVAKALASFFVLLACFIFVSAERQARATTQRMTEHAASAKPGKSMTFIAGAMVIGALGTGAILWLL